MPNIMASAASQQTPDPRAAALNHLAPVVDLLDRSLKSEQAGARRWAMVAMLVRRACTGAKTLLALIGAVAVGGLLLLPFHRDMQRLPALASEGFFVPSTEVAGAALLRAATPLAGVLIWGYLGVTQGLRRAQRAV